MSVNMVHSVIRKLLYKNISDVADINLPVVSHWLSYSNIVTYPSLSSLKL